MFKPKKIALNVSTNSLGSAQTEPVDSRRSMVAVAVDPSASDGSRGATFLQTKKEITINVVKSVDQNPKLIATETPLEKRQEIISQIVRDVVVRLSINLAQDELNLMVKDIQNDILGYGPLEPLLARDDIADIMVNGIDNTFIEVGGRNIKVNTPFTDADQLMLIAKRMAEGIGRSIDTANPMVDARLPDGSRINITIPPVSLDGPIITIRKFNKNRLRLADLQKYEAIDTEGANILKILSRIRCNIIVSGGTGSGKTTLLNCLTEFIEPSERTITCEDTAELLLQQEHVVRLETRTANSEGKGLVTMEQLVRNTLRQKPDRIIVGEVRGGEAFDLLQAMNTGHDGSMGTLHANTPRDAISRLESMVMMGQSNLKSEVIQKHIQSAVDIIVQTRRLRDGSRRITHITEVGNIENGVIALQDLVVFEIEGDGPKDKIIGRHYSLGITKPICYEKARYFKVHEQLTDALKALPVLERGGMK